MVSVTAPGSPGPATRPETGQRKSIRVTLSYREADALLGVDVEPEVRLCARGKLTSALLARRDYVPPILRGPRAVSA